jgi:hypothetical protein
MQKSWIDYPFVNILFGILAIASRIVDENMAWWLILLGVFFVARGIYLIVNKQ